MKHTKRLLGILLISILLAMLPSQILCVAADDFSCTEVFNTDDVDNLYITITGNADTRVTAYVWAKGTTPSEFSALNPPLALIQQDLSYGVSPYNITIPLPNLTTGEYYLKVSDHAGATFQKTLRYLNKAEVQSALDSLNAAITQGSSAVLSVLTANAAALLLEDTDLATYGNLMSQIFASRTDTNGNKIRFASDEEFAALYTEVIAIHAYLNRDTSVALADYLSANPNLGVDPAVYYTPLTDIAKTELQALLTADNGYIKESFATYFAKNSALAAVKTAQKWQDIKKAITDTHKDIINLNTQNTTDAQFNQLINYTYTTFSDIKTHFDTVMQGNNNQQGGIAILPSVGGGGGGGGGIASVGVSANAMAQQINPKVSFTDLPDNHWAKKEIDALIDKKILNGYEDKTFRPANSITRAEFTKLLVTAFGLDGKKGLPFTDIAPDAWYRSYVEAAYGSGVINGTSEGRFSPNSQITREDACVMIYRILAAKGELSKNAVSFSDASDISVYALEAVGALSGASIVNGTGDNRFDPRLPIDRQSAAVIIYKTLQYQN